MSSLLPTTVTTFSPTVFVLCVVSFITGIILLRLAANRSHLNIALISSLIVIVSIATVGWRYELTGYRVIISAVLWSGIWLYIAGTLLWLGLRVIAKIRYTEPTTEFGHDDIQVRIMTVNAEPVVQETIDSLPDTITDRHVIAESPIDINGAEVHVVPDEFSCNATRKGRALEWARRTLACDREYVLYLDEDTIVAEFDGLPDADIVQFGERPYRTGGLIPYLSEMFRIGFQLEQRTFGLLPVPLYAWGGGIAIRSSLEQQVTWNYDTLIEDTVFTWRAVTKYDASFVTLRTCFHNQAPATIGAMISQRRRWIGGAETELWRLPWYYRPIFKFRNFVWGMTPIASVIPLLTLLLPGLVFFERRYLQLSFLLLLTPLLWSILGYDYFREDQLIGALSIPLTPLLTVVHSAGALVGMISRPRQFATTSKAGERRNSIEPAPIGDGGVSGIARLRHWICRVTEPYTAQISYYKSRLSSSVYSSLTNGRSAGSGLPFERRHLELRPVVILTGISVVGAAVRLYGLGGASYWYDEIYSVTVRGDMPLADLLTASEPHPPLYYVLLKYWMSVFGHGEFATRFLSVLFGVGAIIATYFLCKRLFDRSAGYIGAALMALSTFNVHASQTVRMYEPLTFFTAVSLYFMLRVLNDDGYANSIAYVLSSLGVLFTHLFGGFVVLAQNIYALGVLLADSEDRYGRLKRWLITEGFVSVVYISFLLTVLLPQLIAKTNGSSKAGWITIPTLHDLKEGLMAVGGAPLQYPFANFSPFSISVSYLFLALSAIGIVLGAVHHERTRDGTANDKRIICFDTTGGRGKLLGAVVFACCFALPFVLSYVVTPMFVIRYLAPATVGAIVLIAGGVATIRRDSVRVAIVFGLVVSSAGLVGVYHQTSTNEDWRAVSNSITSDDEDDALLILEPAWISKPLSFYGIPPSSEVVGVYQGEYDFGASKAGGLRQTISAHDTVYVVQRRPATIDPVAQKIPSSYQMVSKRDFGDITIYKYTRQS